MDLKGVSREEYVRRRLDLWAKQQAAPGEIALTLAGLDELDALAAAIDVLKLPPSESSSLMHDERADR